MVYWGYMATLYRTDGTGETVTPASGEEFTLAELQGHVGGYIDIVRLENGELLVVNDEGLIHGLPLNEQASRIVGGVLAGDVVRCSDTEVK